uniref:Uncharacterized protein n=1 Tax=Trypanosoma congolense (strain IL3000) TaxID=1068625 RepID=G0UXS6_TRYCI|nr:conserved hypothetical protein [Trypanosoma congolense IL3000]
MWRRCTLLHAPPRVLCLTIAPGGTMEVALKELGYTPYTFRHTFTEGRVATHPQEWCEVLDKKKPFDPAILDASQVKEGGAHHSSGFDAIVGLPGSLAFETILNECPLSTRVILVEETDKCSWANDAAVMWELLLQRTERSAGRRAGSHLHQMVSRMVSGITNGSRGGSKRLSPAIFLDTFEGHVKNVVPRDRLLVYRYGEGWEPLCAFLSKPLPVSDSGGLVPFPANDDGKADVAYLVDRLQRVERVVWWVTCLLIAAAVALYTPFCSQLRDIVAAYYEDYRSAFEPALQECAASGGSLSLRRALVISKNTTMEFEKKVNERGGVIGAAGEALNKFADGGTDRR